MASTIIFAIFICLYFSLFQNPRIRKRYLYLIPNHLSRTTFPQPADLTPVHRNTIKMKLTQNMEKISEVQFFNGSLCFVLNFHCNSCPFTPPPSPYLLNFFNVFWAINQDLFFMSILKKFAKLQRKNHDRFFLKSCWLQDPNTLICYCNGYH